MKDKNIKKEETIFVGDQILTDILCANRVGIDSILVKTIDKKSQKWYTNINRLREKYIIKKLVKKQLPNANEVLELINNWGIKNE